MSRGGEICEVNEYAGETGGTNEQEKAGLREGEVNEEEELVRGGAAKAVELTQVPQQCQTWFRHHKKPADRQGDRQARELRCQTVVTAKLVCHSNLHQQEQSSQEEKSYSAKMFKTFRQET